MPAPYPRALRGRIAELNRSPRHDPHDQNVRDVVQQRAADACEYCLMPTTGKFEVEHIVPKARWQDYLAGNYPALRRAQRLSLPTYDHIANFAWSCSFCNNAKNGPARPRTATRLFDPRFDHWPDRFGYLPSKRYGVIVGIGPVGKATVRALNFQQGGPEGALAERYTAILDGRYPPPLLRLAYNL